MNLAKCLGLVLLLSAWSTPALAGARLGIDMGANLASLHYERDDIDPIRVWDRGWRGTATMGFAVEFVGAGSLSLMTGLRYVQHGNEIDYSDPTISYVIRFRQHYLSLPALVSIRPLQDRRFFLAAGPEVGYLLAAQVATRW